VHSVEAVDTEARTAAAADAVARAAAANTPWLKVEVPITAMPELDSPTNTLLLLLVL
jgi:hypothetical protein